MSEGQMINLNDERFDVSDISIFNDGKAGIVDNVSYSIEKKKPGDPMNAPDYKITYTDSKGSVNTGLYYLDPNSEKFKDYLRYQGADLKHMYKEIFGKDKQLPTFSNVKEMLDSVMNELKSVEKTTKVRVAVCYGTVKKPSAYLRVRNFPPFIESMSVPFDKTELTLKREDQTERLVADKVATKTDVTWDAVPESKKEEDLPF